MKAIFLDVSSLTPIQVKKAAKAAEKILLKDDENTVIVSIGYGRFSTGNRWKLCSELGLERFEVSRYLDMDKGIEIQEWINHHANVDNICVISNEEELRPVEIFRVRYHRFFLKHYIKKMLRKPYVSNTVSKFFKTNARKMF